MLTLFGDGKAKCVCSFVFELRFAIMEIVFVEKIPIFDFIIEDAAGRKIYLGDEVAASNEKCLRDITTIIDLSGKTGNVENPENDGRIRVYLPIQDSRSANISILFPLVENAVKSSPGNVLVCCANAVSRSVTVVLYLLMKMYHMRLDYAMTYLESKRPGRITRPNPGFLAQLKKAEGELNAAGHFRGRAE